MPILRKHRRGLVLLLVSLCPSLQSFQAQQSTAVPAGPLPSTENLQYSIEWRLITAGTAHLAWTAASRGYHTNLQIESAGLVSRLFKVNDEYSSNLDANLCAHSSLMKTNE